ncbi:hypothetical protein AMTR_s00006p00258650 [Amborella trichopoda]|uniref:Agenet domain-containing protein n=1 Tax=Amborella trichopoda TaxID=13333 RepID=W1PFH3_AMBTC|nr:hypothetical protein AMTR_s00006p00258650 [Amborella trichopoda]
MALRKGSRVEVSSDEDGFKGAWFTATVTKMVGKTRIMVEYDNLVSDDENGPLVETLEIVNVRPLPPVPDTPHAFSLYEEVDAFYNDGWWVGVISKVVAEDGSKYAVYFRNTREEMIFEFNQMRVHQDFIDGHWVMASQGITLFVSLETGRSFANHLSLSHEILGSNLKEPGLSKVWMLKALPDSWPFAVVDFSWPWKPDSWAFPMVDFSPPWKLVGRILVLFRDRRATASIAGKKWRERRWILSTEADSIASTSSPWWGGEFSSPHKSPLQIF